MWGHLAAKNAKQDALWQKINRMADARPTALTNLGRVIGSSKRGWHRNSGVELAADGHHSVLERGQAQRAQGSKGGVPDNTAQDKVWNKENPCNQKRFTSSEESGPTQIMRIRPTAKTT